MFTVFDQNINSADLPMKDLAPLVKKYGIGAKGGMFDDENQAMEDASKNPRW